MIECLGCPVFIYSTTARLPTSGPQYRFGFETSCPMWLGGVNLVPPHGTEADDSQPSLLPEDCHTSHVGRIAFAIDVRLTGEAVCTTPSNERGGSGETYFLHGGN